MSINLATLKELYDKVKAGEIDESSLRITLDNDCTSFEIIPKGGTNEEDYENEENQIHVKQANGYYDIEHLYPLLFPKATVAWC